MKRYLQRYLQKCLFFCLSFIPFPTIAGAADANYCAEYARLAVQQSDALSVLSCFRGFDDRWHLDYQRHYDWCLATAVGTADAQSNYRRLRLGQCQGAG